MTRIVKDPETRRQEIVAAARELFQSKSYEETSMQDVMQRLDIAKGTIYHYFKSKEELLVAVVENIVDEDLSKKQQMLAGLQGSALDKLSALIRSGSMADENDEILGHLHQPANLGMHTVLLAMALVRQAPMYAALIRQGCEEGLFQTEHPLECAEFLLTAVQFLTDVGIYPWSQEDLLRRAQAFPALIEAHLKAPSGSFQFLAS